MNVLDQQLQRLFRAAARVRRELPLGAPLALESQTLAQWRRGADGRDELFV